MRGLTLQVLTLVFVVLGTSLDLAMPDFSEADIEGGDYDAFTVDDDFEGLGSVMIGLDLDEHFIAVPRLTPPWVPVRHLRVDRHESSSRPDRQPASVFRPPRSARA